MIRELNQALPHLPGDTDATIFLYVDPIAFDHRQQAGQ